MTTTPLRTVEETAKILNVDPQTVRRWIRAGKIEAYNYGQDYRVSQEAIQAFLDSRKVKVEGK